MPLSVAYRSISASSSALSSSRSSAATFVSSCATLLAPISVDVTRGSRSVHASASCASDWPRPCAISFSARILARALLGEQVGRERLVLRRPRALGNAVQVAVGEHPLRERREDDAADAELPERVEQVAFDPAVQHRVRRLVDQERRSQGVEDRRRLARLLRGVGRDPGVQRLPLPHGRVERAHRLLERRLRVEAVRVEDVDVVETDATEALVEAREQVLPRPPLPVGPGPHVVAGLRRDHQLVPVRREILGEEPPEVLLGRAVRRAVVVREVEMRDAEVERAADDRTARVEGPVVAEVVPEPERHGRQLQPARAAAVVAHRVVALGGRNVRHRPDSTSVGWSA